MGWVDIDSAVQDNPDRRTGFCVAIGTKVQRFECVAAWSNPGYVYLFSRDFKGAASWGCINLSIVALGAHQPWNRYSLRGSPRRLEYRVHRSPEVSRRNGVFQDRPGYWPKNETR